VSECCQLFLVDEVCVCMCTFFRFALCGGKQNVPALPTTFFRTNDIVCPPPMTYGYEFVCVR